MRMQDLEPEFLRLVSKDAWMAISDTILSPRVSGLRFRCPSCSFLIILWRPHVSPKAFPSLGRYEFSGKFLHDLTLSSTVVCKSCSTIFHVDKGDVNEINAQERMPPV
jgi:hypothetical protein